MSNIHQFEPRKPKPKPDGKRPTAKGRNPAQRNALVVIVGVAVLVGLSMLLR